LSGCFEFTQQTRDCSRNSSKGVPLVVFGAAKPFAKPCRSDRIVADPQQALRLVLSRVLSCRFPCANDRKLGYKVRRRRSSLARITGRQSWLSPGFSLNRFSFLFLFILLIVSQPSSVDRAHAMTGSGNSTAQFLDGLEYSTGTGPAAIAVGDLNQDGWQDLVHRVEASLCRTAIRQ